MVHIKGYVFVNLQLVQKEICKQMVYSSWPMTTDYSSESSFFYLNKWKFRWYWMQSNKRLLKRCNPHNTTKITTNYTLLAWQGQKSAVL